MPTIIKLRGVEKSGKTTTLLLLIDKLKQLGAKQIVCKPVQGSPNDLTAELDYNGKKIGIVTAGDDSTLLDNGTKEISKNCDIYIFACRTRGSSTEWIDNTYSHCSMITCEKWFILSKNSIQPIDALRTLANENQAWFLIHLISAL